MDAIAATRVRLMLNHMKGKKYQFTASDATRAGLLLRVALSGPAGSGKTKTSLSIATRLAERFGFPARSSIYGIDSESNNLLKYAYSPNRGTGYRFKHVPMPVDDHSIDAYTAALEYCEGEGAKIIVIDSLTHAWDGIGGVLEMVDSLTESSTSKNAFSVGWKKMSPQQTRFMQRLLESPAHLIFTMRAHMEYVIEKGANGRTEPQKVGMGPVQRKGIEYEPDLFFELLQVPIEDDVTDAKSSKRKPRTEVRLTVAKTRCDLLPPGDIFINPDVELADLIYDWLSDAPPPAEPRTVGEALAIAVRDAVDGLKLATSEERKAAYKDARAKLSAQCARMGVSKERGEVLMEHFKQRFMEVSGVGKQDAEPGAPTTDAPSSPDRAGGDNGSSDDGTPSHGAA